MPKNQIKSKERVRDLAEVFTSEREVNSMLDLMKNHYQAENVETTFFEPSCGNGNFLITILERKLNTVKARYKKQVEVEFYIAKAVASIYGVDISLENIQEAHERMLYTIKSFYSKTWNTRKANEGFYDSIKWIIEKNIILGDMLNKADEVVFIEYTTPAPLKFKMQEFKLIPKTKSKENSLFEETKKELKNYKTCYYYQIHTYVN